MSVKHSAADRSEGIELSGTQACRVGLALLFYIRSWGPEPGPDEDLDLVEDWVPTAALREDQGAYASAALKILAGDAAETDPGLFPARVQDPDGPPPLGPVYIGPQTIRRLSSALAFYAEEWLPVPPNEGLHVSTTASTKLLTDAGSIAASAEKSLPVDVMGESLVLIDP